MSKLRSVYKGEEDLFVEFNGGKVNLAKDFDEKGQLVKNPGNPTPAPQVNEPSRYSYGG